MNVLGGQKVSCTELLQYIAIHRMYCIEAVEHISLIQILYCYTVTTGGPQSIGIFYFIQDYAIDDAFLCSHTCSRTNTPTNPI